MTVCAIEGCGKVCVARGWCSAHYYRWQRNGDPLIRRRPANGEAPRYFREVVLTYEGDECLLWPHSKHKGYGQLWLNGRHGHVHRFVCEHIYGPAPTLKHEAAHSCGKGHLGCVNKRHLRWATPKENEADKLLHGTAPRGERQGSSKLTTEDVLKIRELKGAMRVADLAKQFSVQPSHIRSIQCGRKWSWLAHSPNPNPNQGA